MNDTLEPIETPIVRQREDIYRPRGKAPGLELSLLHLDSSKTGSVLSRFLKFESLFEYIFHNVAHPTFQDRYL